MATKPAAKKTAPKKRVAVNPDTPDPKKPPVGDPREGDDTSALGGLPPHGGPQDNSEELAQPNVAPTPHHDDGTVPRRPRHKAEQMVKVKPTTKHVNITRDDGTMRSYPPGTTEMPHQDATHWYAGAHGVEIDE